MELDTGPAFRYTFTSQSSPVDPCFDGENIYVPQLLNARVTVIRTGLAGSHRQYRRLLRLSLPYAAFDGTKVWVTTAGGCIVINPEDGTFETYTFGVQNRGISVGNGYVYICSPACRPGLRHPRQHHHGTPCECTWVIPSCNGIAADGTVSGIPPPPPAPSTASPASTPPRPSAASPAASPAASSSVATPSMSQTALRQVYSFAADGSGSVTSNTLGFTTPSSIIYDGENLILTAQTGTTVAYTIPGLTPAATAQLDPGNPLVCLRWPQHLGRQQLRRLDGKALIRGIAFQTMRLIAHRRARVPTLHATHVPRPHPGPGQHP